MGFSNVQLLISVNFLHFVSSGLLTPVFTQHICENGASDVTLGLLVAALFVFNTISKDFVTFFNHGIKFSLKFCLFSSFVTCLMLGFNDNLWMIFLNRCFCGLTNQVSSLSKDYVTKSETQITRLINSLNLLEVTEVAGLVVGAICGGYIFEFKEEFRVVAITATVVAFLALVLAHYVDGDFPGVQAEAKDLSLPETCYFCLEELVLTDYSEKWPRIVLLSLYSFSLSAYFSRFAFLLTSHYHVGAIIVGYSVAYQFMWKFFCDCGAPYIKEKITNKNSLFQYSLVLFGLTLSGLYYAPNYETYLILFIPMMVTNSLINSLLEDDVLEFKKDNLDGAVHTITNLIHICGPICFGILCHLFGTKAFKALAVLPAVMCANLMKQKFESWQSDEDKVKGE